MAELQRCEYDADVSLDFSCEESILAEGFLGLERLVGGKDLGDFGLERMVGVAESVDLVSVLDGLSNEKIVEGFQVHHLL